ncbi:RluA family pseudouridine synthase [Entomobacter blattae]|uniref:Ribosomal large subunit pseudouridine synthase C n=1 Tax=Entomobacter blattae TaxID=2762277 RepID=A0A7H1NPM4_9PROT|nr:RNA pseudouridine synthase [Entomobacter blattae]QNT77734.1 Ribosomal large subunit pseudouridine synthase C [Entomobacter blattae]
MREDLFPFPILYQSSHFVIINKPAGIPCSSREQHRPSVEHYLPALSRRKDGPWLVHRLDQETSGCLLIALRKDPLIKAQACFSDHTALKKYWAIVVGHPPTATGIISTPLRKQSSPLGWKVVIDHHHGKPAKTEWRLLGQNTHHSWLELTLYSGRTHQIRVHCQHLGCPVLGDPLYGKPSSSPLVEKSLKGSVKMHLHAVSLDLFLTPPLRAIAPPPPHMEKQLKACGWQST